MRKDQKFHKGDHVRVAKDLGPRMSHFKNDCDAIVISSYDDKLGGGQMTYREQRVIELRKLGFTFKNIGANFGISATRASQIYCKAKRKENLREFIKKNAGNPHINCHVMSIRLFNALKSANISSLKETSNMTDEELLRIRCLGKKMLFELRIMEDEFFKGGQYGKIRTAIRREKSNKDEHEIPFRLKTKTENY